MNKVLLLLLLVLAACARPTKDIERVLVGQGCEQIIDHGADILFSGCSDNDFYNNQFTCVKGGVAITGVVCSGFFKGFTIRYY